MAEKTPERVLVQVVITVAAGLVISSALATLWERGVFAHLHKQVGNYLQKWAQFQEAYPDQEGVENDE